MSWMSISIAAVAAAVIPFLPPPTPPSWPYIIASGLIHIAYNMSLIRAYRSGEFGETYPIARGSSPVLVALGAAVVAGDRLGASHVLGVLLVSGGILFLALQRGRPSAHRMTAALLTGAIIALYTVVDGLGVRLSGHAQAYTTWIFLFYALMPVLFIASRGAGSLRTPLRDAARSMVGGLVSLLAYGIVIWAMQFGAMGAISALRETSVVFAALIARVFLKERLTVKRLAACAVIAAGAVCIGA